MRSAIRRTVVLLAAGSVLLAGCGSGPSQARTAAIVGGTTISLDDVQRRFDAVLRNPDPMVKQLQEQRKLDQVSREIVRRAVLHELIAEASRREGLSVSEDAVSAEVARQRPSENPTYKVAESTFDGRMIAKDNLLLVELAKKYVGRYTVTVDALQVETPEKAKDIARRIAAQPNRSGEIIRGEMANGAQGVLDRPVSNNSPQSIGLYTDRPVVFVQSLAQGPQGGGYQVVYVKSRSIVALPPELDLNQVPAESMRQFGMYILRPLAMGEQVRLNPRYGVWDVNEMRPVSNLEAPAAGEVLPVHTPSA